MAASGNILSHFLKSYFSLSISADSLILGFVIIFGAFIFLGTKAVDHANRYLMVGKIGSFLLVLFLGVKFIKPIHYTFIDNSKLFPSLPILITAFGFHNMIPSLTTYMKGNIKKVKMSILGGSLLSLLIYLLWQILVLGIIPIDGDGGLFSALKNGKEASELLSSYVQTPSIGIVAQLLGFFAILTSFLAQSLSLSHFLDDGLQAKKTAFAQIGICILTLLPPLILALSFPNLFYTALNFAGGICTVVLFGIIPALMIWKGRYIKMVQHKKIIVPGGKPVITVVLLFASCIFLYEISSLIKIVFLLIYSPS
jgi:tyrosine-specific transport protein